MLRAKQIRLVQEEEKRRRKKWKSNKKLKGIIESIGSTKLLLSEKCQYNKKNQPKAQDKQELYN